MNYERIYREFIADRMNKQPVKPTYFEKHHIVPKSIGGINAAENIIRLTAEDHIFAHLLLAKWLNTRGMWSAIKYIFGQGQRFKKIPTRRAIRIAAKAKEEFAIRNSGANNFQYGKHLTDATKEKLRNANIGKKQTKEQIKKASERMKGTKYSLGFKHSEETKKKVAIAGTGRIHSEETKRKMSASGIGKAKTEEAKRKMSEAKLGKPRPWVATEETRRKISAVHKGKLVSAETRAKQSNARIGLTASTEAKAKMSLSRTGSKNHRSKKIVCTQTTEIFGCVKDAAIKFNIPQSSLRASLNRNNGIAFIAGIEFKEKNENNFPNQMWASATTEEMAQSNAG